MITSAFQGFLYPERHRRKAARDGGFAIPGFEERGMAAEDAPFLVTNSRNSFVVTTLGRDVVRYGFSECSIEEESALMREFYSQLWTLSEARGWVNRCSNLAHAKVLLEDYGFQAQTLVVSLETLAKVCGQEFTLEDAVRLTMAQGCVAEVDGVRVQFSDIPPNQMILATTPSLVGVYTRVDDYVGMVFRKINQTVVLINELVR